MQKITIEVTEEQAREIAEKYGKKQGRFVPELGQTYWCVYSCGSLEYDYWNNDQSDNLRLNTGNCFRTREEAKVHADKLHAIAKVTEYIYEKGMALSEEEVDEDVCKYYFYYDLDDDNLITDYYYCRKVYSPIPYINSRENAKKLLAKFPEELNKIYK